MLFSIIIPVYNSGDSIRKCLDSILAQTCKNFEVIIIDDGSNDGTEALVDEYGYKNDEIKVFHFANAGVSAARQKGVSLSNGDYVMFVDSDDFINANLLEHINECVSTYNHPDVIRYQSSLINDSSYKDHNRYNFYDTEKVSLTGMDALRAWSVADKKYAVYWLFAFKRTLFSNIYHFPNLRCYEDLALIPLLIAKSQKVITTDYVGYNYICNNSGSLTNSSSKKAEESRARDFVSAYCYAINNFKNLENINAFDLAFFVEDFNRRLKGKFDSLSPDLKEKLASVYGF